ncbi:MAG TPA: tetratricopeptide repeat protein [Pyrinomonadaceae bacterium]
MRNKNKLGALALAAALLFAPFTPIITTIAQARAAQQEDVPSDAEQALFTKGQNLYNQGQYDEAAAALQDFLKTYPRSIITDLTLLWLGRSYMQMGKLAEAEQVGERLRAIKDTPFAEIYAGELETARRENTGRNASSTTTARTQPPTTTRTPSSRTPSTRQPVATATPTPTPSRPTLNINNRPSQARAQARPSPTPAKTPTQTVASNNPQPRLIGSTPAQTDTTQSVATNTAPSRRRFVGGRRGSRRPTPPSTGTTAAANTSNLNSNQAQPLTKPAAPPVAVNRTPRNTSTNANTLSARTSATPVRTPTRPTTTARTNVNSNSSASLTDSTINSAANTNTSVSTPVRTVPQPPARTITPTESSSTQTTEGLTLTVKQVPKLLLTLRRPSETASPGQPVQLPLTVQNTGNKEDQFRLETDLPAEYQPSFSLAQGGGDTGLPIIVTPTLAQGSSVEVILNLRIPETATDGQQRTFFVRAASQADYQVLKVADGSINVVAAALGANSAASQSSVMPGDTFTQTITVRNQGSAPARGTRADFVFNPNFELVSANPSPITYERASRTAIWSLGDVGARDSRDISVVLRALPNALAATSSLGRGAVRTQSLPLGSNFDSPSITVGKVPRARIDAVSIGLTATPGDTIYVPFVVRNPGNSRDAYDLLITAPNAPAATIYADTNGDGQHQDSEPVVTQTAALDPQGGQFPMLLRVAIPGNTPDGQQYSYSIVARSQLSNRAASEANTVLRVATPRVRVRTEFASDAPAPGETIFYRLVLVNEGSGLAKNLVVSELLPDALEFVSSDPSLNPQDAPGAGQRFTWRVQELAPGDTTVLRIAVRLRQNLQADTNLRTSHSLTYQDTNGNGYTGQ